MLWSGGPPSLHTGGVNTAHHLFACAALALTACVAAAQANAPPPQVVPVTGVAVGTGSSQSAACEAANATARQQMSAKKVTEGTIAECDCEYAPTSRTHSCAAGWVAKPLRR